MKFSLREKQTASNSDIFRQEIVAIVGELLEYECISEKRHKILLLKCSM